ncbi:uncharacterized protein [Mytilus edulis]|uniref:uncharacterized protein n=1 Tax=Mytilus edulis TaxID=6550 RepID=UPI0039EF47F6
MSITSHSAPNYLEYEIIRQLNMISVLLIHTTILLTVTAQKNLTPFGIATQSSSLSNDSMNGKPENAVNPPISNQYSLDNCSSTRLATRDIMTAWWMFHFSLGTAYIGDITIYYRENYANRMSGFKLYVTNTSTIPPVGYTCYEDVFSLRPPYPNISQTIPCNQIGKYVIYYDVTGSEEGSLIYLPIVELCYVAIHDNLAFDSSISLNTNGTEQASLVNDGNLTSCVATHGSEIWVQVDLKAVTIVTEIHITFTVNTTQKINHTIYASNDSTIWENGAILYRNESLPSMIKVDVICRYIIYASTIRDHFSDLEVCEIGIVGCPPKNYGPLCSKMCPVYCNGPCDLVTGNCTFGCVKGWIGDQCELGPVCYKPDSVNFTTNCAPEVYEVYPTSGPVNGGTVLTIVGNYLGNVNDSISIDIGGVRCINLKVQTPYTTLTCVLVKNNATQTTGISVTVNANNYSDLNSIYFTFKEPEISKFSPKKGILSGNTTVTIMGQDIGFEGQNRYNISFCDDEICIKCSEYQKTSSSQNDYIKCKTGMSTKHRVMTRLEVVIDVLTVLTLNETFQYLPDPTFNISTEIPKALQSGGVIFTIRGNGFKNVGAITVERVVKPCDVPEDTSTECETPPRLQNQSNNQTIEVHFDGVTIQVIIEYVDDPTFENFHDVYLYDKQSSIEIKGRNILNVARLEDYHINIGLDGICFITDISMYNITCYPPKSVPRTNKTDENTVPVVVSKLY